MDNLHDRLKDKLWAARTKYFTTVRKSILKLVELPCLAAKRFKTRKILPCEVCKFCIYSYYARIFPRVIQI